MGQLCQLKAQCVFALNVEFRIHKLTKQERYNVSEWLTVEYTDIHNFRVGVKC